MSCNGFKTKNTCGEKIFATCVYIEGELPAITTLEAADCYTLEEVVADTYLLLEGIKGEIEVDTILGETCLSYTLVEGKITVRQVLKTMETEICDLKDKFDNIAKYQLCDLPIVGCDLDLGAMQTDCGDPITTFGELMQAVINLGLTGAPENLQKFDFYNDASLTMSIEVSQPGIDTQVISLGGGVTVEVTIDISKPVFITETTGIFASAFLLVNGTSTSNILNTTQNIFTEVRASMATGSLGNPVITFHHDS